MGLKDILSKENLTKATLSGLTMGTTTIAGAEIGYAMSNYLKGPKEAIIGATFATILGLICLSYKVTEKIYKL